MTTLRPEHEPALTFHLDPVIQLDDDQLYELCRLNRELRIERTAEGGLIVMPPVGGRTSSRNADLVTQLRNWARRDGTGVTFDSSGGFTLPNGAMRAPDAAWVERSRLRELASEQKERFLPLCPDFVIELRSPSDRLPGVEEKMREYMGSGARLGWLVGRGSEGDRSSTTKSGHSGRKRSCCSTEPLAQSRGPRRFTPKTSIFGVSA